MNKTPPGQIITFYSYKGGTGRTMALANIACILAERQSNSGDRGVLMIDWDLEAPGLHRFFAGKSAAKKRGIERLEDPQEMKPGLIDLFYEIDKGIDNYKEPAEVDASSGTAETPVSGSERMAYSVLNGVDLRQYVNLTSQKGLSLIKAGRFNPKDPDEYPERVSKFNWEALYKKCPPLFRVFGEMLAQQYGYVLIDSRTGVTDISGISTMLLPEKLVVVFTPNSQSVKGGVELIRRATDYRKESADLRPLLVFPLVSRVEANEPDLRHDWRFGNSNEGTSGYQPEFQKVLAEVYQKRDVELSGYFDEMQIQHIPRYAYGEEIAVLIEKTADKFSLRRSYQAFANKLVESRVPWEGETAEKASSEGKPGSPPILTKWFGALGNMATRKEGRVTFLSLLGVAALLVTTASILQAQRSRLALTAAQLKAEDLQNQLNELQQPLQVIEQKDETIKQLYTKLSQASTDLSSSQQAAIDAQARAASAEALAARTNQQLQQAQKQYQDAQARIRQLESGQSYSAQVAKGYCCTDGKVLLSTTDECAKNGGFFSQSQLEVMRRCNSQPGTAKKKARASK